MVLIGSVVISVSILYYFYSLMLFEAFHHRRIRGWVTTLIVMAGTEILLFYYLYKVDHGADVTRPDAEVGWWSVGALVIGVVVGYGVHLFERRRDNIWKKTLESSAQDGAIY